VGVYDNGALASDKAYDLEQCNKVLDGRDRGLKSLDVQGLDAFGDGIRLKVALGGGGCPYAEKGVKSVAMKPSREINDVKRWAADIESRKKPENFVLGKHARPRV